MGNYGHSHWKNSLIWGISLEDVIFGTIPAKGIYLRHVDGIELDGIHLTYMKPDTRPVMITDDVLNLRVNNITVDGQDVTSVLKDNK